MDLKDKTVLITGSSSGIGRAIAIACAQNGAKVFIHYRKNRKGAEETRKEVEKYSFGKIFQADLSKPENATKLFKEISAFTANLDILVNNAGESTSGDIDNLDLWYSQFQDNFFSAVYTTSEFLKTKSSSHLRKIVNTSTVYSFPDMINQDFSHYSAAKAAINSYTISLAKKLAPDILVNAVAPGYTQTPPWAGCPKDELAYCKNLTRIKRFVQPEEIAEAVVAVLKNDAITGEIVRVDGGLHLWDIH